MHDTTAILLAAGLSRRMGAQNKLLLPINGIPMIQHMVAIYHAATNAPVLVVTGHEAERVTAALEGSQAITVFNRDYAQGQPTSVACGLRAVAPADRFLICLGDQPELHEADLLALLVAHDAGDPAKISIPQQGGQRGNPIVIPWALRDLLLADPHSPGCKRFTRAHLEHVQFHALPQRGFYADIDTPDAYAALSASDQEIAR